MVSVKLAIIMIGKKNWREKNEKQLEMSETCSLIHSLFTTQHNTLKRQKDHNPLRWLK